MPHYFFDTSDGDTLVEDDTGLDLRDAQTARREAMGVLPDIARDDTQESDRRIYSVRVRDDTGTVIYSASLSLSGEWHVSPPS